MKDVTAILSSYGEYTTFTFKDNKLFSDIYAEKINDSLLEKSCNYESVKDSYANVKSRINGLQYLEQYLDTKNLIFKYIKDSNIYSSIEADFLIQSTVNYLPAHIFLRQRKNENIYCVCSFFVDSKITYLGNKTYWLYKAKENMNKHKTEVLYNRLVKV